MDAQAITTTLDPLIQEAISQKVLPGCALYVAARDGSTLYSKGWGQINANDPNSEAVTPQSPTLAWSCTKLVTCIAALQLVEQGKIGIWDAVEDYLPDFKAYGSKIFDGVDEDGKPKYKEAGKKVALIHLLTHSSGLSYDFFNKDLLQWRIAAGQQPNQYVTRSALEDFQSPLLFEPGTRWEYGVNNDWMGMLVQKLSGKKLDQYFQDHITGPLGLKTTREKLDSEQEKHLFGTHLKNGNGLQAVPIRPVADPPITPGGHYLNTTTEEYVQILLPLLNGGKHPVSGVRILQEETVNKYVLTDLLPEIGARNQEVGVISPPEDFAPITSAGTILPSVQRGYSAGLLIAREDHPNGRSKGSGGWVGLGNDYFWIDPVKGIAVFFVTQVLPFFDRDILYIVDAFERAIYGKPQAKEKGEAGSNFEGGWLKV